MAVAHLIYDAPEHNADLFYITGFWAPDAYIYINVRNEKFLFLSDLEIDRGRKEAAVDRVMSINPYLGRAKKKKGRRPAQADVIGEILKDLRVRKLIAHRRTSFDIVDSLRKKGVSVKAGPYPFYPERLIKTREERRYIEQSQRAVFAAMRLARDVLRASRIKGKRLVHRGSTLTSERMRTMVESFLLERGFEAHESIISCGRQSIDPHEIGSGPLRPNTSIIVDVFPRSKKTFFFGDATRTFCKGRAPAKLREMYEVVKEGQSLALGMVRAGAVGNKIHERVLEFFEGRGYPTGVRREHNVGFFHGTGHGIGLEVHEEPVRINQSEFRLRKGHVTSVEPGLYYPDIGGVRIEDLVYVTKRGCDILAGFPKKLEIR